MSLPSLEGGLLASSNALYHKTANYPSSSKASRGTTRYSQHLPSVRSPPLKLSPLSNSIRFIKRNSQSVSPESTVLVPTLEDPPDSPLRHFPKSRILNLDEIPLPFEFLDGYTYDIIGTKAVDAKTSRSGWGKRQATLILYIFADGEPRLRPTLIFHGQGNVAVAERAAYHPDVVVEFDKEACNNEDLFPHWIDKQLQPTLEGDTMLVMDVASFHKTDTVRARLQKELPAYVLPAMIPGGLTCLLQPLDTAVNSMFKKLLQDAVDQYISNWEKEHQGQAWAVKDKRIMMTNVVAKVWHTVCTEKQDLIVKSFIDTGIAIRPDGSQNHLVNIKGIPNSSLVWDGWEEAVDIKIKMEDHEELPAVLDDLLAFQTATEDMVGLSRYGLMPKDELVRLCKYYGLKVSGNKASLVESSGIRGRGRIRGRINGRMKGREVWLRSTYWWGTPGSGDGFNWWASRWH
jgi:hypothetical protein